MKTKRGLRLCMTVIILLLLIAILSVILLSRSAGFLRNIPGLWGFDRVVSSEETALRLQVVETAEAWAGSQEADGSHLPILDVYNSHTPLARGYAMQPEDAWCSAFASAVAIECGLTDIIPTEVGCERHIWLFEEMGIWQEDDGYTPLPGDYIFYCWTPCFQDDCTCWADHVGIVVGTWKDWIMVIEGNLNDQVGYHCVRIDDISIRGFGIPDYASVASR